MTFQSDNERVFLQPCIILHHRPYRNTSMIIDVFSQDFGRLALVAKGVQQKKSKLRGILQPFQHIIISWVRRSELGTLTGAELSQTPVQLTAESMYAGLYINELLIRSLEKNVAFPELFAAYLELLSKLAIKHISPSMLIPSVLRIFEKQLLKSLGFEMQLLFDINDQALNPASNYRYILEQGIVESDCLDKHSFKGEHLLAIHRNEYFTTEIEKIAQYLIQLNLYRIIGDKPLKTRELYKAYKSL